MVNRASCSALRALRALNRCSQPTVHRHPIRCVSRKARPSDHNPRKAATPPQQNQNLAQQSTPRVSTPSTVALPDDTPYRDARPRKAPPRVLFRQNPVFWTFAAGAAASLGTYIALIYMAIPSEVEEDGAANSTDASVHERFTEMAEGYDELVNSDEWFMNLNRRRKDMTQKATGDVLESAVGTGRNMHYYNRMKVRSLTMVDRSQEMVRVASQKWNTSIAGGSNIKEVRFLVGDVEDLVGKALTADGQQPRFDTVLQSMGVCSTATPVRQLCALGELVKTEDEGGRIFLLEHGRAKWDTINGILDKQAGVRAKKMGCWWNRDIGKLIEKTGLEVVEMRRFNFGTTWYVELKRPVDWKGWQPGMEE